MPGRAWRGPERKGGTPHCRAAVLSPWAPAAGAGCKQGSTGAGTCVRKVILCCPGVQGCGLTWDGQVELARDPRPDPAGASPTKVAENKLSVENGNVTLANGGIFL